MLLTCCTKDSEVQAQTVENVGKTLVVYYSYTNNCHEIVTSLTSQIQADVMRIEPADKTQKYEANNYAIGTALLNAIKAAPNEAASYPAIDPVSVTDLSRRCGGARWRLSCKRTYLITVRRWQVSMWH